MLKVRPNSVGRGNAGDAVRAVGQRDPVGQHDADDLAERQRDDREIVAAQPQHRKAEQDAPERRQDAGQRQAGPEAQAESRRQQRVGIGADRVERDVAKVEQSGEADDDVQAPAQHDVGQHEGAEVDVVTRSGRTAAPARATSNTGARYLPARVHRLGEGAVRLARLGARTAAPGQHQQAADEHQADDDGGGDRAEATAPARGRRCPRPVRSAARTGPERPGRTAGVSERVSSAALAGSLILSPLRRGPGCRWAGRSARRSGWRTRRRPCIRR